MTRKSVLAGARLTVGTIQRSRACTARSAFPVANSDAQAPDHLPGRPCGQLAYYRAIAPEYEQHALPFAGGDELSAALGAYEPTGTVLELACGSGARTEQLLRHATEITAVDAPPEMLSIVAARVNSPKRVRSKNRQGLPTRGGRARSRSAHQTSPAGRRRYATATRRSWRTRRRGIPPPTRPAAR